MQSIPPSVLSVAEMLAIDIIAIELQSPRLTPRRRSELAKAIDKIAARYAWGFRLAD
jgi:hypothetical protein